MLLTTRGLIPCVWVLVFSTMETLFWFGLAGCHLSLSPLHPGSQSAAAGPTAITLSLSFSASCLGRPSLLFIEVTHAKYKAGHWFDLILLTLLTVFTVVDRLPPFVTAGMPVRLSLLPQDAVYNDNVDTDFLVIFEKMGPWFSTKAGFSFVAVSRWLFNVSSWIILKWESYKMCLKICTLWLYVISC